MRRCASSPLAAAVLWLLSAAAATGAPPERLRVEVVASYPHDHEAFTQGLLLHGGTLYESTGLNGRSSVRKVELETGRVLERVPLPADLFGEGLALAGDRLVQLTWRNETALVYDLATLARRGELSYSGEGWGLCWDGHHFVQSDGSHRLTFRDPTTFAVVRQLAVTDEGRRVSALNELECVGDLVYANVWLTDRIVAISARNGTVRKVIDASDLLSREERAALGSQAVLNGIAHDPKSDTFLLTGKLWPKLFRVRFVPQ